MSTSPSFIGAPGMNRTCDLRFRKPLLYPRFSHISLRFRDEGTDLPRRRPEFYGSCPVAYNCAQVSMQRGYPYQQLLLCKTTTTRDPEASGWPRLTSWSSSTSHGPRWRNGGLRAVALSSANSRTEHSESDVATLTHGLHPLRRSHEPPPTKDCRTL